MAHLETEVAEETRSGSLALVTPRRASASALVAQLRASARSLLQPSNIGKRTGRSPSCNRALKLAANQVPLELLVEHSRCHAGTGRGPGQPSADRALRFPQQRRRVPGRSRARPWRLARRFIRRLPATRPCKRRPRARRRTKQPGSSRLRKAIPGPAASVASSYGREDAASFVGMGDSLRANLWPRHSRMAWTGKSLSAPTGCWKGGTWRTSRRSTGRPIRAIGNFWPTTMWTVAFASLARRSSRCDRDRQPTAISPIPTGLISGCRVRARRADLAGGPGRLEGFSAHVRDVTDLHRQYAVVRRGLRRDAVAPVWQGVTIIPDEVTLAG